MLMLHWTSSSAFARYDIEFNFLSQAMSDKIEQLEAEMQVKDKVHQLNLVYIYFLNIDHVNISSPFIYVCPYPSPAIRGDADIP